MRLQSREVTLTIRLVFTQPRSIPAVQAERPGHDRETNPGTRE
jgi:hypothetical protein